MQTFSFGIIATCDWNLASRGCPDHKHAPGWVLMHMSTEVFFLELGVLFWGKSLFHPIYSNLDCDSKLSQTNKQDKITHRDDAKMQAVLQSHQAPRLQRFWVDVVPSVPTLWICATDGTWPALHVLSTSLLCSAFCLRSKNYPLGHRVFKHEPRSMLTGGIFSTVCSSGGAENCPSSLLPRILSLQQTSWRNAL